ncbi:peptidoglycan-binding protein, partial [Patescibacteria group bacterium]|nr:peptidoglycan-binding protein [Patescibacteria group bacterium]
HSYEIPSQLCYEHSPIDPSYQRSFTVTGASFYSPTDTVTLTIGANSFKVADTITVSGMVPSAYNGIFQVTAVTASTISYVPTGNPGAYSSGGMVTWPNIRDFNGATCYPGDFSGSNASTVPVSGTSGSGNTSGSTNGGTSSAGASTNSAAGGGSIGGGSIGGGGGGGGGASIGASANSGASNSPATNSPTTPCVASPSAIPASALSLTIGTRGPDVTNLQTFLVIMGYLNGEYITGYFGPLTKAALTSYQASHPSSCSNTQAPSNNNQTRSNNQISPFTRSLKLGMTGNDVKNLQIFLNSHGFTVSQSGAGSSSHETSYFGPATFRAVIRFQNAYANQILAPYGLSQGTGFFGPSTMKEVNQLLSN